LHWPLTPPLERRDAAVDWLQAAQRDLGLVADIQTWTELDGRNPQDPLTAGLLFVGGANIFNLLDQLQRSAT